MVGIKTAQPIKKSSFVILALVLLAGLIALLVFELERKPSQAPVNLVAISLPALEDQYGLRVNLLAVTASGGMVDLRLKFVDSQKARLLLQDKKNFPALQVSGGAVRLQADEETQSQSISFDENGGLFLMFPNSGNAVKPGTAVTIVLGNYQLEPIVAR